MLEARGPIGCPPGMLDSMIEMVDEVFRPGMRDAFPHLFNEGNLENCRVTVSDGKVVSHIGFTMNEAEILGARVSAACLGAVGTYEAHRGRGYASAEFEDCLRRMESLGAHILVVSGDRSLYCRNHCMRVGRDFLCGVGADGLPGSRRGDVAVEPVGPDRIDEVIDIKSREPVRFVQQKAFWLAALEWMASSWRRGSVLGVRVGTSDELAAYLIVSEPNQDAWCRIHDYGGDRDALAGALGAGLARAGASSADLHVPGWDARMLELVRSGGIEPKPSPASGTQRVVDFPGLMDRLRPVFAERIGAGDAAALEFAEEEESFTIRLAGSELVIPDRDQLVRTVFGTHEGLERGRLFGSRAAEAINECLPVPALNYGISYV